MSKGHSPADNRDDAHCCSLVIPQAEAQKCPAVSLET